MLLADSVWVRFFKMITVTGRWIGGTELFTRGCKELEQGPLPIDLKGFPPRNLISIRPDHSSCDDNRQRTSLDSPYKRFFAESGES